MSWRPIEAMHGMRKQAFVCDHAIKRIVRFGTCHILLKSQHHRVAESIAAHAACRALVVIATIITMMISLGLHCVDMSKEGFGRLHLGIRRVARLLHGRNGVSRIAYDKPSRQNGDDQGSRS